MIIQTLNNSITVQNWYASTTYGIYDITQGLNIGNASFYGPMYFSTVNSNVGNNPSGQFIYHITQYSRGSDLATITVAFTGACPNYARGSLFGITGLPDPFMNATGMILNANSGSAGQLTLQFVNPGPVVTTTSTSLGGINSPEPSWTTGFFFSPTYQSTWDAKQSVITAQFEPGYQQRQPQSINSNTTVWNLLFDNRTDAEAKAIMAFVQNVGGVYSVPLLLPPSTLFNNPNLKYVLGSPKVTTKSYNQSDITVPAAQVFEY